VTGVPACRNCGSFVTPRFVRVFGTNDSQLHACPDCAPVGELMEGKGAQPEAELRGTRHPHRYDG
jgi:hypothetical protein